jgi:hypothetical protein
MMLPRWPGHSRVMTIMHAGPHPIADYHHVSAGRTSYLAAQCPLDSTGGPLDSTGAPRTRRSRGIHRQHAARGWLGWVSLSSSWNSALPPRCRSRPGPRSLSLLSRTRHRRETGS